MKSYSEVEYMKEIKDKSVQVGGWEPWKELIWPLHPMSPFGPWDTL